MKKTEYIDETIGAQCDSYSWAALLLFFFKKKSENTINTITWLALKDIEIITYQLLEQEYP